MRPENVVLLPPPFDNLLGVLLYALKILRIVDLGDVPEIVTFSFSAINGMGK